MTNDLMGFVVVPNTNVSVAGRKYGIYLSIRVGCLYFSKGAMEQLDYPPALNIFVDEKRKRIMAKKSTYGQPNSFALADNPSGQYQCRIYNRALTDFLMEIFSCARLHGHVSEDSGDCLIFE